ncbi:hypothetical protein [Superficieibacter sp.]|uniref:hypothetical protein n=1 Tax=Superficieibacter sp. TaxID=2303322 RepID=UPI0028A7F6E5|nr:hypothetical protein [Superficieibacter sp.]
MKKIVALLIFSVSLSGCVSPQPYQSQAERPKQTVKRPSFPVDEYLALPKKGTGVVKGELFGVTRGGDVKIGAGAEIITRPYTSYLKNTPSYDYNTQALEPFDKRMLAYDRKTRTDAQGKFEFDNLPPGKYTIFGMFSWMAGSMPQFVMLSKTVDVNNDETVQVQP